MGHQQQSLFKTNHKHRFSHGGILRRKKLGRSVRPLSCKEPLHIVFKANRSLVRSGSLRTRENYLLINNIIKKYAFRFHISIHQLSIQGNHIHLLIKATRRFEFHYFFRVVAGQIAQRMENQGQLKDMTHTPKRTMTRAPIASMTDTPKELPKVERKLWAYRVFSRVVRGYRAYRTVVYYIRLNELEALGRITYQSKRLKRLSMQDWQLLWG